VTTSSGWNSQARSRDLSGSSWPLTRNAVTTQSSPWRRTSPWIVTSGTSPVTRRFQGPAASGIGATVPSTARRFQTFRGSPAGVVRRALSTLS
jgi:hypothetical protein